MEAEDPDLQQILWHKATEWDEASVRRVLSRRGRPVLNDPHCSAITHFKRTGKYACYEFFCFLYPSNHDSLPRGFWLPYLDVLSLAEAAQQLERLGWTMHDHFQAYSDGEEVWESGGDSQDEQLSLRRSMRGRSHALPSSRIRGQKRCHSVR
jgi:hypothetical protein